MNDITRNRPWRPSKLPDSNITMMLPKLTRPLTITPKIYQARLLHDMLVTCAREQMSWAFFCFFYIPSDRSSERPRHPCGQDTDTTIWLIIADVHFSISNQSRLQPLENAERPVDRKHLLVATFRTQFLDLFSC